MTFKILSGSVERAFAARPGTLEVIATESAPPAAPDVSSSSTVTVRTGRSRVVHLPAGRSRSSDPTQ
jgi:hypothetical protein